MFFISYGVMELYDLDKPCPLQLFLNVMIDFCNDTNNLVEPLIGLLHIFKLLTA